MLLALRSLLESTTAGGGGGGSGTPGAVARIGDTIDHGGTVTSGSSVWFANNIGVARVGDTVECSIHGTQTITSGNPQWEIDGGRRVARVGSTCSCGAVINSGSPNVYSNN